MSTPRAIQTRIRFADDTKAQPQRRHQRASGFLRSGWDGLTRFMRGRRLRDWSPARVSLKKLYEWRREMRIAGSGGSKPHDGQSDSEPSED